MVREILKLGNPSLYQVCEQITESDSEKIDNYISDLRDTIVDFKIKTGFGRAIAAPQIGIFKRLVFMKTEEEIVFINPVITPLGDETMLVMDDCMSFPGLLVKVLRHRRIKISFLDAAFNKRELVLEGDLAELLQHECDHLNGVLATMRAIDNKSFFMK